MMRTILWTLGLAYLSVCLWISFVVFLLATCSPNVATWCGVMGGAGIFCSAWMLGQAMVSPPSTWPRRI